MALLEIVKAGSQQVRIYAIKNRGNDFFKLSYNWAGEWRAKLLRDYGTPQDARQAKSMATEIAISMSQGRADRIGDISKAMQILRAAEDSLSTLDVPVDIACREYAYAHEILNNTGTLIDAARYFAQNHTRIVREVAVRDAVEEFIAAQQSDHASPRYIQDIRNRLRRFARENGGMLSEITSGGLKLWLRGLRVAPRTRNNFLSLLKTFFHWAQIEGYLPRTVPTAAHEIARLPSPTEIHIHTPEEVATMLGAVEHEPICIRYLAIGYFAGVRPNEMQRMTGRNIRFEHNDIEVKDWQAKGTRRKRHRRLVPMQPNLISWLSEFPVGEEQLLATSWARNRISKLTKKLGVEWHHDVMRHTAISNMVALTQNVDQVALWAGNSRQIIYTNYLNQVTPKEAKAFFSIVPPRSAKNVVRLKV